MTQSDRSARGGRCRHRRRHPRPHPLRGRARRRDRWSPRRDHRRGDSPGLCRAGGVRQQPRDVAGLGDRGHRRPRRRPEPSPAGDRRSSSSSWTARSELRAATGAKSDPLDAIRAAREATGSTAAAGPARSWRRTPSSQKHCQCYLAARRSAINASTEAQLQVFSLVIAAPEPIRVRFRGQKLAAMLNTAANLRVRPAGTSRRPAPSWRCGRWLVRAHAMLKEAREHQKAIVAIIRSCGDPTCSSSSASDRSSRQRCCAPGPTPAACTPRPPSRCSPASHRSRRTVAKSPPGIGSTGTAIASSTEPYTPWSESGSSTSQPPATTSPAAGAEERPAERSNAALPATSPATSTACLKMAPQLLDEP